MKECKAHTNNFIKLIVQLKVHEGFSGTPYKCTADKETIGYGRNLESNPIYGDDLMFVELRDFNIEPMTVAEATYLLQRDIERAKKTLEVNLDFYDKLSEVRQCVLINMVFNIGYNGLLKFKKALYNMKYECFEEAAKEMLDSKWATQVHSRAFELAEQMRTNKWQA